MTEAVSTVEPAGEEDIWHDDLLDRQSDAQFLIDFLVRRVGERQAAGLTKSYVLNLNAKWGQGKTYFLKRLAQQLEADGYLAVYVNAWEDDHAEDPLIAVISAIDTVMKSHFKKKKKLKEAWDVAKRSGVEIAITAAKRGLSKLAKKAIGEGVDEIADLMDQGSVEESPNGEDDSADSTDDNADIGKDINKLLDRQAEKILKRFSDSRRSISRFRNDLGSLLASIGDEEAPHAPLFVLIDELDRCRPTYALALLERVKHIFDVDDCIFIIATDSEQLRCLINTVYGTNFDSGRYLLRFFDRAYEFEQPELEDFIANLFHQHQIDGKLLSCPPSNEHQIFFLGMMQAFDLSLRDAEQCVDMLRTIITVWQYKAKIELLYMMPLIFAFQQGNLTLQDCLERRIPAALPEALPSGHGAWSVGFPKRDSLNRIVGEEGVPIRTMLQSLLSYIGKPLPKITADLGGDELPVGLWFYSRFREEFQLEHNSHHRTENPPMSLLRSYPELVGC